MSTPDSTDAAFEYLRFERDGDVLVVTIDKPDDPLNKVDDRLHHELTALFPRLQAERDARAVLLTGTGSSFSAGGDFDWFPQLREPGRLEDLRLDARRMIDDLLDKRGWLVISAIQAGHEAEAPGDPPFYNLSLIHI